MSPDLNDARVAFRLPSSLLNALMDEAARQDVTFSELVRRSLCRTVGEEAQPGQVSYRALCDDLRETIAPLLPDRTDEEWLESGREATGRLFTGNEPEAAHALAMYFLHTAATGQVNPIGALSVAELFAAEAIRSGRGDDFVLAAAINVCMSQHDRLSGDVLGEVFRDGQILKRFCDAADAGHQVAEENLLLVADLIGPAGALAAQGDR